MQPIHISLAAEKLGTLRLLGMEIPLTNSLLMAWVVMAILIGVSFFAGRKPKLIPSKTQLVFESLFDYVLGYMEEVFGSRKVAEKFFPLIVTIFLFIFTANMIEFTPGVGSVGFFHGEEFTPLLRSLNTDFNVTLALAIISFFAIEISGIAMLGFLKYGKKFVNVSEGVMGFFLGIMEFISEMARLVSFSFRLFGNIFAGEVLIAVTIAFLPLIAPVPLMLYELFVGLIQAAIFALLTLFFIKLAITDHSAEAH